MSPTRLGFRALLVLTGAFLAISSPVRSETTLIEFAKSEWRYLDDGSDAGTAWREPGFDDSSWKAGASPLGYGEHEIRTLLDEGSDPEARPLTAYFRHTFEVRDPSEVKVLHCLIRSDDGFVLYLNGKEGSRGNLPDGEVITHKTTANFAMEGGLERHYVSIRWSDPPLRSGENVVAVEVHQSSPASDDLFFDLHLKSFPALKPFVPAKMAPGAREAVYAYWQKHYVGPEMRIPDGYVDGGRGMKLDDEGNVGTLREVIVVDRTRDQALRRHLEFARSELVKALPPVERARELVRYINREIAPDEDPVRALLSSDIYIAEHRNSEVLIGRVDYGVCRHRSLLFKMMADESGLEVALVRGNYRSAASFGGHAWNELKLPDGRTVIVDTTNPAPDLYFPPTNKRGAERYLTVRNEPWYIQPDDLKPVDAKELREIMRIPNWRNAAQPPESAKRPQEERASVEAALKLEPQNVLANLALATLLMKEDESEDALARAYASITKATESLGETATNEQLVQQLLAFGFFLTLAGDADNAMQCVEQVLVLDEDHETAAAVLRLLRE